MGKGNNHAVGNGRRVAGISEALGRRAAEAVGGGEAAAVRQRLGEDRGGEGGGHVG